MNYNCRVAYEDLPEEGKGDPQKTDMSNEVFISYSSKDKAVADAVCHVLEQHGMQCWIAPRDVQPGARYAAEIVNGLKNCKVMVLVYSKESNQSKHVANEVDRAFNGGKTIILLV